MKSKIDQDLTYNDIVNSILNNNEFHKIKEIEHHGVSRYDHSLRVSYYSYKLSKMLKLNYIDVARAGLLHDFFLSKEERSTKDRFISIFTHPKKAVEHTEQFFRLNNMEKNIIQAHMFPFYHALPKYAESWVVSIVDKVVGSYEFLQKFGYKLSYAANIYLIFLLNNIK